MVVAGVVVLWALGAPSTCTHTHTAQTETQLKPKSHLPLILNRI